MTIPTRPDPSPGPAPLPVLVDPEWVRRFPWIVQGTTTGRGAIPPFDLGLFAGASPSSSVLEHWERLLERVGLEEGVHARQLHGPAVRFHGRCGPGLRIVPPCDGHLTRSPGVLLTVGVADCVPAFLVCEEPRAVGVLHMGWRGTAAGILERAVDLLRNRIGTGPRELQLHLGPAICGRCYEVGPEVWSALGYEAPMTPTPIDLREAIARRALRAGFSARAVTRSAHCTRCTGSDLFSHRGGDQGRQVGYIGIRT